MPAGRITRGVNRSLRVILAGGALVLLVVASVVAAPSDRGRDRMAPLAASHQPSPGAQDDPEGQTADEGTPSQELLDRLVAKLRDAGVDTNAATIEALAADHGVGGAVRLLVWSQQSGLSTGDLAAMLDPAADIGWGEIAHQLNEANGTSLHPGLGSILGNAGGNGHGRENAPGQQKQAE